MKAEWTNKDSLTSNETTGKAILIIDMPTTCRDCPCGDYNICSVLQKTHTDKMDKQREEWCPLSPLKRVGNDFYIYDRK